MKGKLIAIYGINNIGKTAQTLFLRDYLISKGHNVKTMTFPNYKLEPTGPKLYSLIKSKKQNLTEDLMQTIFSKNLKDMQPILQEYLDKGYIVIFDGYRLTSLVWGSSKGLPLNWMKEKVSFAIKEDLAILLDGSRFKHGIEKNHIHEHDDKLQNKVRQKHLDLADEYNCVIINANQPKEQVHEQIVKEVEKII